MYRRAHFGVSVAPRVRSACSRSLSQRSTHSVSLLVCATSHPPLRHSCVAPALQLCCCYASTSAASSSIASDFPKQQPTPMPTHTDSASTAKGTSPLVPSTPPLPLPPPLSILSWAVDGSGHTHHHCARRLSMAQRIPLLRETIRRAAPDIVALQDSTAELAMALTMEEQQPQMHREESEVARKESLKVYCIELAKELGQTDQDGKTNIEDASAPEGVSTALPTAESPTMKSNNSDDPVAVKRDGDTAAVAHAATCSYRLVGKARNGHCGEVQLFVKTTSAWDAVLLRGMGAGVTVELTSHTNSDGAAAPPIFPTEKSEAASTSANTSPTSSLPPYVHRCVLTTLDLSYRGKSLGTHVQGMLSDALVSAEGSPFTLQAPQPSPTASTSTSHRGTGRAPGQLDVHRAVAFDWVHHHVRPDVLVGNVFMGARERVSGFEDAWVRAGSPSGQERTTNTCARHRVDHMTNYFYFRPSPGVASKTVMEKLTRQGEEQEGSDENTVVAKQSTATIGASEEVPVAADAPVGTPIPLDAYVDISDGAWHTRGLAGVCYDGTNTVSEVSDDAPSSPLAPVPPQPSYLATGMPEVAGRFQRCFFRAWVRRGPPSRSGHLSAHPFVQRYRRCRVVVLRPMTEVELSEEERAWHTRYITALYSPDGKKRQQEQESQKKNKRHDRRDASAGTGEKTTEGLRKEEVGGTPAVGAPLRLARVPARVRCSLSDQYPLLTLLN